MTRYMYGSGETKQVDSASPILGAQAWPTNGALIADVAALHFPEGAQVLDPTYGRGLWWTDFKPLRLFFHDLADDGIDFRDMPYADESFDVVAFDPPYISMGGRKTSGLPEFMDRYGLSDAPRTPDGLMGMIREGMTECVRVLKPGGLLLVKCQDYVTSGKLYPAVFYVQEHAQWLHLRLLDRFEHLSKGRAQPPGRRQVHARRNHSTLLVFKKS